MLAMLRPTPRLLRKQRVFLDILEIRSQAVNHWAQQQSPALLVSRSPPRQTLPALPSSLAARSPRRRKARHRWVGLLAQRRRSRRRKIPRERSDRLLRRQKKP